MPETPKSKLELPWGTLLPLIAALAGIVAQYRPLVSSRPATLGEKSIEAVAEQDVDARLWQDPLTAAQKQLEEHEREQANARGTKSPETDHPQKHDLDALAKLIKKRTYELQPDHHILLLAVMIDAGPYVEQGESRLRSRRAILEGLSQSGFAPKDSEHIGFISTDWPLDRPDGKLLIPWEECQAANQSEKMFPRCTDAAFVLWLPASNFNPVPLTRFAALIDKITESSDRKKGSDGTAPKLNLVLIGPTNSDGLRNMIQEAHTWHQNVDSGPKDLNGLSIISARASVPDKALLAGQSQSSVREVIEGAGQGLHFLRSVTPDDTVLQRLIDELQLRGIGEEDKIVILTEWDSIYGRWLGTIFASLVSKADYLQLIQEKEKFWPPRIYSYQYLRGIDGRLPGGRKQIPSEQEERQKNRNEIQPKVEESTEGTDQSDFLRRLARELKDEDLDSRRKGNGRIRAIGLLGADIYDKLMILRALRPEFPEAIFFTNNYDAHFERREDWHDVRNLVIASAFGGKLPKKWQSTVTPFRDSNQTSMHMATLVATQRLDEDTAQRLAKNVTVFEIGRQGAYDLDNSGDRYWFRDWLQSYLNKLYLVAAALTLVFLTIWIRFRIAPIQFSRRKTALDRCRSLLCDTPSWLVCGSVATILLVCWYAQTENAVQEPLQFLSGISIWPTEILRLIALMLSIHFMIKASVTLKLNERDIFARFSLANLPADGSWRQFWRGFASWRKAHKDWEESKDGFSAEDAWHTLLCHNKFWPRILRVSILVALYLTLMELLRYLFLTSRLAFSPARGEMALHASYYISMATIVCFTILSFYVVDAIQLNGNFIRVFTNKLTKWPHAVYLLSRRSCLLSETELSPYNDVLFVAERTKAVALLIWYPLIVLAILVLARSSFFDNWTWPPIIVVTYTLNALWAIGSAIFLRRVAEKLRRSAIESLQLRRNADYRNRAKREAFDDIIDEIRSLKTGAFAPLTEQPFIRATLLPGAGLGILSVGQRLLEGY